MSTEIVKTSGKNSYSYINPVDEMKEFTYNEENISIVSVSYEIIFGGSLL